MIEILENLIQILMIQMSLILGNIIHLLASPLGAVMAILFLVCMEGLIVKSIMNDPSSVIIKKIINYAKNNIIKDPSSRPLKPQTLGEILQNNQASIKEIPIKKNLATDYVKN